MVRRFHEALPVGTHAFHRTYPYLPVPAHEDMAAWLRANYPEEAVTIARDLTAFAESHDPRGTLQ